MPVDKIPTYYATQNLGYGEPDYNRRFLNRTADHETIAVFTPDKGGWSERNQREFRACLLALNTIEQNGDKR